MSSETVYLPGDPVAVLRGQIERVVKPQGETFAEAVRRWLIAEHYPHYAENFDPDSYMDLVQVETCIKAKFYPLYN
ncbi:hypothetical protein C1752_10442 [Acaryochloris thomasi RCC1774]|uniref:Uncharacterized protein n=1 Tax=Acaryochloris thomasi RCC1774 TaxID=1764569 RepID=A0A2W1JHH6_9CYAN|nr:hypothetical protein [Acaryochloris thomasi]PZD70592.1 hypothetical protein C1752_10442 [Acaryochloris thomasi RCC1774]